MTNFYTKINDFTLILKYIVELTNDDYNEISNSYCFLTPIKILLVFDIDETILTYKNINNEWWKNKLEYYYKLTNNYELSEDFVMKDWIIHIHETEPQHTEINSFNELLNFINIINKNNNIIDIKFLTARDDVLKNITIKHLQKFLPQKNINISFTNGTNKSAYLQNITNYDNIIFVDDLITNLQDVYEVYNNKIQYYLFEM